MKKVISVREIVIVIISVLLIACTTEVFALNPTLSDNNNTPTVIQGSEYENAQQPEVKNDIGNNTIGNNTIGNNNSTGNNSTGNNTKVYNTNNTTDLPQTGKMLLSSESLQFFLSVCVFCYFT